MKKLTRCWTNGVKTFPSVYGAKWNLAWELLYMGHIKLTDKERIKYRTGGFFFEVAPQRASKILEDKGYRWKPYKGKEKL